MTTADRNAPHHDTLTCYTNYNCRLPECVERKNAWMRTRDRALRAGTWQPMIDAAPVREHLEQLLAEGFTQEAIAITAGVPHQSISDFTQHRGRKRGLRHRTYPDFAQRILAVTPATINAGRIDSTGTRRRVLALVAHGWPLVHIGRQLGMDPSRADQIILTKRVYVTTRNRIAEGYDRIKQLQPEKHGVPAPKAAQARERAKAKRWPTPSYWDRHADGIDDPHFEPMYGVTRREQVAQDANWVMRTVGLSKAETAARLGVDKSYIEHAFRDHPEYAVGVAA